MRRHVGAVLLLLAVGLSACGSSGETPARSAASAEVTVLAASSLTGAFTELGSARFSFAGSQAIVAQVQDGSPADVVALADQPHMRALVDAGLVEKPVVFGRDTLEIVVEPGNPKRIKGLADLGRDDLAVVLADPTVPVGHYSREVLTRAGVTVHPRSLELDVKAALAKVTSGEADAAIVYASDVRAAGSAAMGVAIPRAQNVIATYPMAVVRSAKHRDAAEAFVHLVLSPVGQRALRANGFLGVS